jgi:hypothetical protein
MYTRFASQGIGNLFNRTASFYRNSTWFASYVFLEKRVRGGRWWTDGTGLKYWLSKGE